MITPKKFLRRTECYCRIFQFYFLIFISSTSIGQVTEQKGLDDTAFKRILNQQFTNIVTGQNRTTLANFAALDLKEPEVTFAGSFVNNKGYVLGVKASGGVKDGLFSFFNNSKLNTKVSLEFNINILNKDKAVLAWDNASIEKYEKQKEDLFKKYRLKEIAASENFKLTDLKLRERKLIDRIGDLNKRLAMIGDLIIRDSVLFAIKVDEANLKDIQNEIKVVQNNEPVDIQTEDVRQELALELKKLKIEPDLYRFKFSWFSVFYRLNNSAFQLFDSKKPIDDQVMEKTYLGHELKIQFNKYNWSKETSKTFFYNVGVGLSLTDNQNDLKKRELNDFLSFSSSTGERTLNDKYNVFIGNYTKDIKQLRFYSDYYQFIFHNNAAAFHIYPEFVYRSGFEPTYNIGTGFLYSFKDSKKEDKTNVNAEIYYNFLDIFNNLNSTDKLLERNSVGLRFTFPINFKSL